MVKITIENILKNITNLEKRLEEKITSEIADAISGVDSSLQYQITEITDAYSLAIKNAKDEITASYTSAIKKSIATSEESVKTWVGDLLKDYYTIAEVESKLAVLKNMITDNNNVYQEKITELTKTLGAAKKELTEAYQMAIKEAIEANKGIVDKELSSQISELNGRISSEVESINQKIVALASRLDNVEGEINSVKEQLVAVNASISDLQKVDVELKGYIEDLQSVVSDYQKKIETTNSQIDDVKALLQGELSTTKADFLAQLEAIQASVISELAKLNGTITTLQSKDTALEKEIVSLKAYVESNISNGTEDWVSTTFATLEQYNALVSEVATLKTAIESTNSSIASLESTLKEKLIADIATAISDYDKTVQQKVNEITDGYIAAISTVKKEMETAYTGAIQNSISNLEISMKEWVNEQLTGYCTLADLEAQLSVLKADFENQLLVQRTYLEGLIITLTETLTQSIADNKSLIETIRSELSTTQGEVVAIKLQVAANAEKIAANAEQIKSNIQSIRDNQSLIAANSALIKENKELIGNLSSSGGQIEQIVANAEAIANQALLIAQNSVAIENQSKAISANTAAVEQLKTDLSKACAEITEAYQSAVTEAINAMDGKLQSSVVSINARIDNEVSSFNSVVSSMQTRINSLETEIGTLKTQISQLQTDINDMKQNIADLLGHIQSITYIPRYDDGKASVNYTSISLKADSYAEFDFQVYPKDAAIGLAANWDDVLTMKAVYTQTRGVSFVDMPVLLCTVDVANGVLTVKVSGANLSDDFFAGTKTASAALNISDEVNHIESAYVPMIPNYELVPSATEIFYTSLNETVVEPYSENVFGANIISNTYENGVGIITFDGNVTQIGEKAFYEKTALTSISFPTAITEIGKNAFYGCSNLSGDLIFPECLVKIGELAFSKTGYTGKLVIGSNVTEIGENAFASVKLSPSSTGSYKNYQAHRLSFSEIYCRAIIPPTITSPYETPPDYGISSLIIYGQYGTFGYYQTGSVYVPEEALSAYQNNSDWEKTFAEFIGF